MHRTKSIATYVHRIINIRLQWRAIVDAERYIWYIRLSCTSLANMVPPSSHAYIRYALNIEYYYTPTRSLCCIPTALPSIKGPPMIDIRMNVIYVQHQLIGVYVSGVISINEGFSIGLIIHNNQPCRGRGEAKDSSIYFTLVQQVPIEFSRWQILLQFVLGETFIYQYVFFCVSG